MEDTAAEDPRPLPVSSLDEGLRETISRSTRALRAIILSQGVALVIIAGLAGYLFYRQVTERPRIDAYLSSQCPFFYSLATTPLPASATKVGVELIEGSRQVVLAQGCVSSLPPPSPVLLQLGQKYGVRIMY